MRFPELHAVALPATFVEFRPGRLHPSGMRYLPLIVLRLASGVTLGVVDRHHRVDAADVGQRGIARLIFQLSAVQEQPAGQGEAGIVPAAYERGEFSIEPLVLGRIARLHTWEQHRKLGYESVYTEMLLDVGAGTVGLRTTITGDDLNDVIGATRLDEGAWVRLENSRIDILEFTPERELK